MVLARCDCCGAEIDGSATNNYKAQIAFTPASIDIPTWDDKLGGQWFILRRDLCPDCLAMIFALCGIDPETLPARRDHERRLYDIWNSRKGKEEQE